MSEAEAASRARARFLALIVLFLCLGFTSFLLTGDSGKAALLTFVAIATATCLFLLAPHRLNKSIPLWIFYLAGFVGVLGPIVGFRFGYESPWDELRARYGVARPVPHEAQRECDIVLMLRTSRFMARRYPLEHVECSFGDTGAGFALTWPLSLVYEPFRIPVQNITACAESSMDYGHTRLEIYGLYIAIAVRDYEGRVRAWCREREIDTAG